jgi:hypothetical protein
MLSNLVKSIQHKSYFILNELAVPQVSMLKEIIGMNMLNIRPSLSRFVTKKLFKYLLARLTLEPAYTGMVAVIDLV